MNSLWIGDELGYIEKLTLASALSVGHSITLFSYAPGKLRGVPVEVEVRDANLVVPYQALPIFRGRFGRVGTDFFRYAMQAKGLGYSVDLELYFIRPIDFVNEHAFGWEHESSSTAGLPGFLQTPTWFASVRHPTSALVAAASTGRRKTAMYDWRRLTEGDIRPEDLPVGTSGPMFRRHLARKYGVARRAKERSVLYPVTHHHWKCFALRRSSSKPS